MRASFEDNAYRYLIYSLLLLLGSFRQAHATYYLNQADGYDSLPSCAEQPISSIVRDMVAGCGDGGKTTSYSCFCTASSDRFREIIATSVAKNCGRSGVEVESATSVFDAYCQMEKTDKVTTCIGSCDGIDLDIRNWNGICGGHRVRLTSKLWWPHERCVTDVVFVTGCVKP
ncbi:hypothetical protein CaCOL14_000115 [Colletotrichum acutatum]